MSLHSETVQRYLERDSVIREALRRGVVNQRALARWLIQRNGWVASEEAVLSIIRRSLPKLTASAFEAAEAILAKSHLNMRSRVAIVKLSKTQEVQKLLPKLFNLVDYSKGEALRVIQSERSIKVLLDESNLPKLLGLVEKKHVEELTRRVSEINVVLPLESQTTPGVGALMTTVLALRGINMLEFITGIPEVLLFVADDDALAAYEGLSDLIEQD